MDIENVVIIGSGPAGYTAAIYAARADLRPVVIEGRQLGGQPGGQLMTTTEVENYPGFPDGLLGPDLVDRMKKQSERFGTRFITDDIVEVDFSSRPFKLKTSDQEIVTKSVIIATGAQAMWLNVPGENEYKGRGVSACATCDGFFFRGKDILVVGGGDSAMEEANVLTRFANKVTLVHRRDEFKASKIMQERVRNNPKIDFLMNSEIREVIGNGTSVTGVKIFNNQTNQETNIVTQGIFVAIGHKPNTTLFTDKLVLDVKGYIVTKPNSTQTSVDGVFAAGDVADHKYRQAIVAAGSGAMAALDAERWLIEQE